MRNSKTTEGIITKINLNKGKGNQNQ